MILTNELKGRIVAKGYTYKTISKKLGMTDKTFSRKMKKGVFGSDEIERIIEILEIEQPEKIFFASKVT